MKDLAALLLPAERRLRFPEEVKATLSPEQFETVRAVFEEAAELLGIVEAKKISMSRLCARVFGPKTEKGQSLCGGPRREHPAEKKKRPGHGRGSHRRYTGARRIQVPHPRLKAGDPCPDCGRGKLRRQKEPARSVKLTAQPPVAANIHEMERLRCDACNKLFTAPAPEEAKGCHCNVHARRQFVDIRTPFAEECRKVVEAFGKVYKVEAECREENVGAQERLRRHQEQSGPVMEALREELQQQMDQRKIEPNSALGGAVKYTLKRWSTLTMFLKVPGAPIDNNEAERLLKNAILHRKNSLHYRTQRGADVGDTFMTVIETCRANRVEPFMPTRKSHNFCGWRTLAEGTRFGSGGLRLVWAGPLSGLHQLPFPGDS